jgi:transcriptional regulator with XRE-family HTH domain
MLGLSEATLARAVGIGPEQIEAYERAMERVPSEHLARLGEVMGVPLSYFYPAATCSGP